MNQDHISRQADDQISPASSARSYPLPNTDLGRSIKTWLADGQAQGLSARTLDSRRYTLRQFAWWLERELGEPAPLAVLTPALRRAFVAHTREPNDGGRYGSEHRMANRSARLSTVRTYYGHLRAFLNFCVAEGLIAAPSLRNVKAPRMAREQVQPFSLGRVCKSGA